MAWDILKKESERRREEQASRWEILKKESERRREARAEEAPQEKRESVMDLAINTLRDRVSNSSLGQWANNFVNTAKTHIADTAADRATAQQKTNALTQQEQEDIEERRRQQYAIDMAQLIDQGSSKYEGPTKTVRRAVYDEAANSGQNLFANDWEPPAERTKQYVYETVRNESYKPLAREERDDLINKYADAVNGKSVSDIEDVVYQIEANGGIKELLKQQSEDAAKDGKYAAQIEGLNFDGMSTLERLGETAWNTLTGTEKQWLGNQMAGLDYMVTPAGALTATAQKESFGAEREAVQDAAWNYVSALVGRRFGGTDEAAIVEARNALNRAVVGDPYLTEEYYDPTLDMGDARNAAWLRVSDQLDAVADKIANGDATITRDNILDYIQGGDLGKQVEELYENDQYQKTYQELLNAGQEELNYAKMVNPASGRFGNMVIDATSSSLSSAQSVLLSRFLLGGAIGGVSELQSSIINKLAEAGASKFLVNGVGFVGNRLQDILGMASFGVGAYGASANDARQKMLNQGLDIGVEEAKKIKQYAAANAWNELGSEMLFSSIGSVKNASGSSIFKGFSDELGNALAARSASPQFSAVLRIIGRKLGGGVEEGLEEVIGDAVRDLCDFAGIIGEDDRTSLTEYITDFMVGAMAGLSGEATNVVYKYAGRQQAGNAVFSGDAGITFSQLYDLASSIAENRDDMTSDAAPMAKAFDRVKNNGKGATVQNAGLLFEAYQQMLENQERGEEAVDKAIKMAEDGKVLTKADLNKILQSDAARDYATEVTGAEITGENASEQRASLKEALEALAIDSMEAEQTQTENVASEEENANTPVSAANPFMVMNQNTIDNIVQRAQPMSLSEKLRDDAENNPERRFIGNVIKSAYSVDTAAEKLGVSEEARDTMMKLYSPAQGDTVEYAGQAVKYINQGKNDEALDLTPAEGDVLTPAQKQAFWNEGRMETIREEARSERTEESGVREIGERNDGESSGRSLARVEQRAETYRAGEEGFVSGKRGLSKVRVESLSRDSLKDIGLKDETDSDKPSVVRAKAFAEKAGVNLVAWSGGALYVNGEAVRGYYDPSQNTIYVRTDHAGASADMIAVHELTHDLINKGVLEIGKSRKGGETLYGDQITGATLRDAMVETLGSVEEFNNFLDSYVEAYYGTGYSDDRIWEEQVCDAAGQMNEHYMQGHREAGNKIAPAMEKLRNLVMEQVKGAAEKARTDTGRATTERRASIDRDSGPEQNAVSRSSLGRTSIDLTSDALGVDAYKDDAGKIHFFVNGREVKEITADHVRDSSAIGTLIKQAVKNKFITEAEAKKQYQAGADLMNMIMETQDPEMTWAFAGATMFSALKKNSDGQYGTTIDFTTVCRKTQEMVTAMSNAMREAGRGLTKEEVTKLQHKVLESGAEVPCPVCYVFSRWAGIGGMLDNIVKLQDEYAKFSREEITARTDELKREIISRGLGTKGKNGKFTVTGEGVTALTKQLVSEADDAEAKIEWYEDGKKGAVSEAEYKKLKKELPKLKEDISILSEWTWASQIVTREDYKAVPKKVLFDLDAGEEFASNYQAVWKYRTTRGPSSGKAILPYSSMRSGDIIAGAEPSLATRSLFSDIVTNKSNMRGEFTPAQKEVFEKAMLRTAAQNLIGGQRYQSTSDFRYEYALDYIQSFWELQALGSKLQTYTKVVEYADIIAAVGGDVNLSVMPLRGGVENGKLIFSNKTGMNIDAALEANRKFDNAQLILVGINDEHIMAALDDHHGTGGENIGFVIPYHTSGASITDFISELVKNLGERFVNSNYRDYSKLQNDVERSDATAEQKARAAIRKKILTGKASVKKNKAGEYEGKATRKKLTAEELSMISGESVDISGRSFEDLREVELKALAGDQAAIEEYVSWSAGVLQDLYEKMYHGAEKNTVLSSTQAEHIMPHEYWNTDTTRANAYVNGFIFRSYAYSLGLKPRFSWMVGKDAEAHGDLTSSDGYWKTLIDRPMYNNDGTYREQQRINVTDFDNAMLKPAYAEKTYPNYKIQEPNRGRAAEVGSEYGRSLSGRMSQDLDSKGNTLTESQAEYFADSVVRNKKGALQVMYHGTNSEFNTFKRGDIGYHFGNKSTARTRAGRGKTARLMEVYLNITNPIVMDEDLGSWDADYRLTQELFNKGIITKEEGLSVLRTDSGYKRSSGDANNKLRSLLESKGYDGITYPNSYESSGSTSYIAFKSNQAKLTTNENPTDNADVRFSRDLDNQYMAAAESGDTETAAKLVEQAAEAAGYTVEGYHGTQNFGFTKIDPRLSDDKLSFFVTNDLNTARTYSTRNSIRKISDKEISADEQLANSEQAYEEARSAAVDFATVLSSMAGIQGWADVQSIQNELEQQVANYADDFSHDIETFHEELWSYLDQLTWDLFDFTHENMQGDLDDRIEAYEEWFDSDEVQHLRDAYGNVSDAYTNYAEQFTDLNENSGNYHVFIDPSGLLTVDGQGADWNDIPFLPDSMKQIKDEMAAIEKAHKREDGPIINNERWVDLSNMYDELAEEFSEKYHINRNGYGSTRSIAKFAKDYGYTGVLFRNIVDDGGRGGKRSSAADVYALFNPKAQVKSADPITYDDDGNIIPLSERFNPKNDDIRFSRELKSESVRAAGEKLTERQFYSLYSAHKLDMRNQGNIDEQLQKIRSEGFKGTGGFMGNVMPTNLSYNYKDGKAVPANVSVSRYAPRKGDRIMFVPRSGINPATDSVKLGYRPMFDYEIVTADYDYQPYYEMYSKAYDKAKESNAEIRYSRDLAPTFYSKLEREIESFKGDKIGASSAISYLKGKGVKDEDIKWSGIATFLEGKKSVNKDNLLQYLRDNQIHIEEESLGKGVDTNNYDDYMQAKRDLEDEAWNATKGLSKHIAEIQIDEDDTLWKAYGVYDNGDWTEKPLATKETKGTNWEDYKVPGGENYREILYKLAGSEYENPAMRTHWRGTKGVLAHARVQDFETGDGRILFVDEIQSDWHNAGEKSGYGKSEITAAEKEEKKNEIYERFLENPAAESLLKKIVRQDGWRSELTDLNNTEDKALAVWTLDHRGDSLMSRLMALGKATHTEVLAYDEFRRALNDLDKKSKSTPDAPFRNGTYIQYVLKDLLRKAAEGGYDYLAWTTGKMQEDRWSSAYAEGYRIEYDQDIPAFLKKYGKQWGAKLTQIPLSSNGNEIAEYKKAYDELYNLLTEMDSDISYSEFAEELGHFFNPDYFEDEEIAEMYSEKEIDRINDLSAYLDDAYENGIITPDHLTGEVASDVPAIPITDAMRDSVLYQGQPMFSRDLSNTELYDANRQLQKDVTELRRQLKTKTEQYKYWKGQTKVTEGRQLRIEDVTKLAREIIKGQESSADAKAVAEKMKALGEYILNSQDENVYDEARLKAYEVAHDILSNAKVLNTKGGEDFYSDFRTALKNQTIYVAPSVREEVAPDGWNDFRKAQFGTVNMTADQSKGKSVDKVYHDLQATFGEWLLPEYITSEADQLNKILEIIETYRPVYENLNSYEMADAVEWTANEILTRIIGNEIRETNPTYADRMEKKLADQKAKAQTALKQVRQQRDRKVADLKAHYQQVAEDRRNRKIDSEMRSRLLKIAKRLNNKKLDRATRALLNQYIGEIDLVSKGILGRTVKELEGLRDWYENWVEEQKAELGEDFVPDTAIENRIKRLSKKRINDLTQEEVLDLTTVLLNIEHTLRTQNQFIDSEERKDTYAAAMMFREDYLDSKAHSDNGFVNALMYGMAGRNKKSGGDGLLTPERAMHRLANYNDNDPAYKLGKELSAGQRKMLDYQMRANALFNEWLDDKKFIDTLAGKKAKWIAVKALVNGEMKDVRITPAMRMSLYLHAKNEQNLQHIERGGVLIPNEDLYKRGDMNNAYKEGVGTHAVFSRYMIHEIAKGMSDQEKAFADRAYWYFNNMSKDAINDTSEKHKGYAIATVDKYFPIESSRDFLKADFGMLLNDGSVAGQGFLNERNVKATNPVMLYDMNDVLTKSIAGHSRYYGLALPVQNLNKLLNVILLGQESSIRNMLLDEHTRYVDKMVRDVQTGAPGEGGLLPALRSNYAGGVLGLNGGVAVKQAASYATAAAVIGYEPLLKALRNPSNKKVDLDLIAKYTPLLWYRRRGFSNTELGDIGSRGGVAAELMSHKALNWIQGIDIWTTTKLWTAAEYYVQDNNKNLVRGTDAFNKEVANVYNRIIEETQPNYTAMQRPGILRSDNQLTRALNMFKTQPFQNANILIDAYGNMRAKARQNKANPTAESQQALKDARKDFARAVTSQAISAFVFSLMQFVWDIARGKVKKYKDDDDEMTFWSASRALAMNIATSLGGMVPFGGTLLEFAESWVDSISKALGGEAVFDQKFYGLSENSLEAANDLLETVQTLSTDIIKAFKGDASGETSARNITNNLATIVHMATGIPASNIVKDFQVLALNAGRVIGKVDGDPIFGAGLRAEYNALRVTTDPAKYPSDYYAVLWKAYNKDRDVYNEILGKMLDDGFDENKIKNYMEKKMKQQQGVSRVDDLESRWMSPEQQKKYDAGLAGMESSSLWNKATEEQQQKAQNTLYNLSVGNADGQKVQEKIDAGKNVGLDQTEYLLFQLALSMSDADGSGKANQAEAEAAALMVPGLSAEERAYLFQSVDSKWKTNPFQVTRGGSIPSQTVGRWTRHPNPFEIGGDIFTTSTGLYNGYGVSMTGKLSEKRKQLEASTGADFYRALYSEGSQGSVSRLGEIVSNRANDFTGGSYSMDAYDRLTASLAQLIGDARFSGQSDKADYYESMLASLEDMDEQQREEFAKYLRSLGF